MGNKVTGRSEHIISMEDENGRRITEETEFKDFSVKTHSISSILDSKEHEKNLTRITNLKIFLLNL